MHAVRDPAPPGIGRLLRVLLVRQRALSPGASRWGVLYAYCSRRELMDTTAWIVTFVGLAVMAWVVWYFWLYEEPTDEP